jgi:rhamnogalacturonyl hydrolase YesR
VCGPLYELAGNDMARQVCKDVGDLVLNKIPRNDLGMLKHDDYAHDFTIPDAAYFYVPALFIAAKAYNNNVHAGNIEAKKIQDALIADGSEQLKKFTELFLDKEKKIAKTVYRHGKLGETFWTRANGWLLWTIVESVEYMDKNSEIYAFACDALDKMAQGIMKYQDPSGAMHLLVDEPDTPLETTGTIMTAYGIHKAVRMGWIDRKYLDIAVKAWQYVDTQVDNDGNISGCYYGWAIPAEERETPTFGPLKSAPGMLLTAGAEFEK